MIRRGECVVGVTLGEREFVRFVDFGAEASAVSQDAVDALAREFRAVRRQARQAARRELLAEIRKASAQCNINDAWGMGVIAGLECAAEMAKGKAKR